MAKNSPFAQFARTTTTNGAAALSTTGNALVNFFFNVGASRTNPAGITADFKKAFAADPLKATAILLWARDIRHDGAGERQTFRVLLKELVSMTSVQAGSFSGKVVNLIPEVGRYDDLKTLYGTRFEANAVAIWRSALLAKNVLAAKWAKREDKKLQKAMGLNEANLRKLLSGLRKEFIPEAFMAARRWDLIQYDKIPSVAGMRYAKAFRKHDGDRYDAFINNKDTKVNASAAFPYDVYRMWSSGTTQVAEIQKFWEALPDLGITGNILGIADVSGSMWWDSAKVAGNLYAGDIAIAMSAYTGSKVNGRFKDYAMTFSTNPKFVKFDSSKITEAFRTIHGMDVGGSTNIEGAYKLILSEAVKWNVPQEEMPDFLIIYSDMQFNQCTTGKEDTVFENMKKQFKAAGYKLPKTVFWNLSADYGNFPTANFEGNVAMVSGYSPNILKAVVKGANAAMTPVTVMEDAIAPFIEMLNAE